VGLAEVMQTDVISVSATTPLDAVVTLMLQRGLRFVPVFENDRLVGVITNGDLVERGGLPARLELHAVLDGRPAVAATKGRTAGDVMTVEPIAVLAGTSLRDVARLMLDRRVKRIPVLSAGRVVGVVSRYDLLAAVSGAPGRGSRSRTGVAETPAARREAGALACAGDIAVTDVPTVSPDTALPDVLDALLSTRLHRAVVIDTDRHVVGIVSDAGLLRRLGPAGHHVIDRLMRRTRHTPRVAARCDEVMMSAPRVVDASTPILDAIRDMIAHKVKLLPVVDGQQRLVGMIDRADALRVAFDADSHIE
jgi:CBS domain-containing protein